MSAGPFGFSPTFPAQGLRRSVVDPITGLPVVTSAAADQARERPDDIVWRGDFLPIGRTRDGRTVPAGSQLGKTVVGLANSIPDIVPEGIKTIDTAGRMMRGEVPMHDDDGRPSLEAIGTALGAAGLAATGSLPFAAPKGALRVFGGRSAENADLSGLLEATVRKAEGGAGNGWSQIYRDTGWFEGRDGLPRFEISDQAMKLGAPKPYGTMQVKDVVDHPELFRQYPELGEIDVLPTADRKTLAYANGHENVIGLNFDHPGAREAMLHELQHFIQAREGFAQGTSVAHPEVLNAPSVRAALYAKNYARQRGTLGDVKNADFEYRQAIFDRYQKSAGETEARNVMARADLSEADRRRRGPWTTADVPDHQQWVPLPGEDGAPVSRSIAPMAGLGAGVGTAALATSGSAEATPATRGKPPMAGSTFGFGIDPADLLRLFSQAPMGAPQGFSGTSGTIQPPGVDAPAPLSLPTAPGTVPLPPARPPAFGFGGGPAPAAPQADVPTTGAIPTMGPAPSLPAPAAPAAPAQAPAAPEGGLGDMLKRFRANGGLDMIGAIGQGLLTSPTWGIGLGNGLQIAQAQEGRRAATDLARAEYGLKVNRLNREQQGENATKQYLLNKGFDETLASAAMGNTSVLSSVLSQMSKDPSVVEVGGNKYSLKPGEKPTPENLLGPARDVQDHYELLDTAEKRAAAGLAPNDPRVARVNGAGEVKFDPAPPAPTVHVLEDENGIKHIRQYDPATQSWIDPAQPPGSPPPPTNPLALKGKVTNEQAKAAGFSDRMLGSEEILAKNAAQGAGFWERMRSNVPLVGNYLSSDEYQSFEQAKRDFTNAQLRRESGAAIGKDEFASADRQYFPQPGDSDSTIKQKAANRRTAIEAMIREGGQTYLPPKVFNEAGGLVPFQRGQKAPASAAAPAPRITSKADYDRLPSGTPYMAPDGSLRTKP